MEVQSPYVDLKCHLCPVITRPVDDTEDEMNYLLCQPVLGLSSIKHTRIAPCHFQIIFPDFRGN